MSEQHVVISSNLATNAIFIQPSQQYFIVIPNFHQQTSVNYNTQSGIQTGNYLQTAQNSNQNTHQQSVTQLQQEQAETSEQQQGTNNRQYTTMNYFDASESTQYRFRKELRTDLNKINKKLLKRGLSFGNLIINDIVGSENVQVKVAAKTSEINPDTVFLNKEEGRISDKLYHKLRKSAPLWPSIYRARQFRVKLATMFPTIKTENGIYNKPQSKIEAMAKLHLQHLNLNSGKKIQIKLSADGAQVGRKSILMLSD